jgi:hypothetical protein
MAFMAVNRLAAKLRQGLCPACAIFGPADDECMTVLPPAAAIV